MSLSCFSPMPIVRCPVWRLCLHMAIATFVYLNIPTASAAPAGDPAAPGIIALIEQLGRDTAADVATMDRLRPLIKRHRVSGPDRATIAGLPEDAWLGTLETQLIDRRDAQGNILTALAQRILNSGGDALRVFSVQGELESVADGVPVIVTGYRVGGRVLITGISHPPLDELP